MIPAWLWAVLAAAGTALLVLGAKVASWWRGREVAKVRGQLQRAELERDAASGRAAVAEAEREVVVDHLDRQEAAAEVAEELDHAVATAGGDHLDRRAAALEWMRAQGGGARAGAGGGDAAAVRDKPAAGPAGKRDPGKPR